MKIKEKVYGFALCSKCGNIAKLTNKNVDDLYWILTIPEKRNQRPIPKLMSCNKCK
jgi:hypothetical protein